MADRLIEVIDERQTGETILDEALKMMKSSEKYGAGAWVDLMSGETTKSVAEHTAPNGQSLTGFQRTGETWNVMKIGYQLKQVRERLAKGLVDKGVLRTEKRNFLLFDMATHPVADPNIKEDVVRRVLALLTARTAAVPPQALQKENIKYRHMRAVTLVCAGEGTGLQEGPTAAMLMQQRTRRASSRTLCSGYHMTRAKRRLRAATTSWPSSAHGHLARRHRMSRDR